MILSILSIHTNKVLKLNILKNNRNYANSLVFECAVNGYYPMMQCTNEKEELFKFGKKLKQKCGTDPRGKHIFGDFYTCWLSCLITKGEKCRKSWSLLLQF